MNFHNIEKDSMLNGDGLRDVLFVSGCNHYCKGCQNPQTWDPKSGILFTAKHKEEIMNDLKEEHCAGLTLCGGDPMYKTNVKPLTKLCKEIKEKFPNITIWMYTGDKWEDIKDCEIIEYIDVVIDGEFKEELADVNYPWAGSTNQRVIDVKESIKKGEVILHKCDYPKVAYKWDNNLGKCISCTN